MRVLPGRWRWNAASALALVVLLATALTSAAAAAEYVLGTDDVLSISVYLHPELERTATIDAAGNITFPPVGQIKAVGLTPRQLGDRIADKLSTYLRQTTAVTVTVTQFLSHSLNVNGAVAKPGRYGFEVIPSLVDVIAQAGGAVPGANLTQVQIVRRQGANQRTIYADVASALRTGDTSHLPPLEVGDTIILSGGVGAMEFSAAGNGVGVIGEVGKPGLYTVGEGGQDLWSLLAVAGGITREGNLNNVRVITREGSGLSVVRVDLRQVLESGARSVFMLKDGDVVYVPRSRASLWSAALQNIATIVAVTRDVYLIQEIHNRGY
jgi:polysaccharide export outer membrane protein